VTSFFAIKGAFFSKTTRRICANFFQGLGVSTCSLQPALKSNAPGLSSIAEFPRVLPYIGMTGSSILL